MQYSQSLTQRPQLSLFQEALFGSNVAAALAEPVTAASNSVSTQHISELQLNASASNYQLLLAPILRELSTNSGNRWITLVAPPGSLNQEWLRQARLNRERIIVLQPRGTQSALELTCQALSLGRSHTVISWLNHIGSPTREVLEAASSQGHTQLLNIRCV